MVNRTVVTASPNDESAECRHTRLTFVWLIVDLAAVDATVTRILHPLIAHAISCFLLAPRWKKSYPHSYGSFRLSLSLF